MKTDFKNLIVGFILGLALALAIGVYAQNSDSGRGRYEICPSTSLDIFYVLDTQTGDVYGRVGPLGAQELILIDRVPQK